MCEEHQPAGRWDQGVQGNLWSLHLPSVQTYPADLWDQALHQHPENEKHTHFNCLLGSTTSTDVTHCLEIHTFRNTTDISSLHLSSSLCFHSFVRFIYSFKGMCTYSRTWGTYGTLETSWARRTLNTNKKKLLPHHPIKELKYNLTYSQCDNGVSVWFCK